jgi:hypothetical protein
MQGVKIMPGTKLTIEQFINATDGWSQPFIKEIHSHMVDGGCKETIEEKKTSIMTSYKHKKTKKSVINLFWKKEALYVRIYGENINQYLEFFNVLPEEMVSTIGGAGDCKRLVSGGCSPKCAGYDLTIGESRFQKCRYGAFEFPISGTNENFVKKFVELELQQRNSA